MAFAAEALIYLFVPEELIHDLGELQQHRIERLELFHCFIQGEKLQLIAAQRDHFATLAIQQSLDRHGAHTRSQSAIKNRGTPTPLNMP